MTHTNKHIYVVVDINSDFLLSGCSGSSKAISELQMHTMKMTVDKVNNDGKFTMKVKCLLV